MESECEEEENIAEEEELLIFEDDEECIINDENFVDQESENESFNDINESTNLKGFDEVSNNLDDSQEAFVSEEEDDDPTLCSSYNVIVLDEEDDQNIIIIDEDEVSGGSDYAESEAECHSEINLDNFRVIVEEGYLVCYVDEVEPAAFSSKSVVEDVKLVGSAWDGKSSIEVSVNIAVYPPLEKLPDKAGAFIFNGHKYYTVKGGRRGVTYYSCWRARKKGTCPVRCKVRSDRTVEITGEHNHPPISSTEELRTEFKRHLRDACLSVEEDIPIKEIYQSVAEEFPEGAKLYSYSYARRLMVTCRNTIIQPVVKPTPKPPQKYFPPDAGRIVVPGRGYFLDGFKYYKMKTGLKTTYFKCSEAKRGCRACCRVRRSDGSAIVSGIHIHDPADDKTVFIVDNFKSELRDALSDPKNVNQNIREIYRIAAEKDPGGAELYPFDVAKHYLFKRRGRTIPPRPPEIRYPPVEVPPYGKRFIHLNYKYHLVKKRAGKSMYYKCGQWKSGCQVNLRILRDGAVVVGGKHTHEPAPEIEIERRRLMEQLRFAVLGAGPRTTLRQIYQTVMSQEGPEKVLIYPWKHAWYFMERLRKKKVNEEEQANPAFGENGSYSQEVFIKQNDDENEWEEMNQKVGYYKLIDEEDTNNQQETLADEETEEDMNGEVKYEYYIEEGGGEESGEEIELDAETAELLKNSAVVVKVPKFDFDQISSNHPEIAMQQEAAQMPSKSTKKRSRRKAPFTIDPNIKRVVIVPVYPQNMVEDNATENMDEVDEGMYQEVIVNEDGSMEPAIIFVEDEVEETEEDIGEVASGEVVIADQTD